MSTILITRHNENIYNLLKPEPEYIEVEGRCKYKSKFSEKIEKAERKTKQCHKTFGYAEVPLNKPNNFLKKHARIVPPRPVIDEPRCLKEERRPPIPRQPSRKKTSDEDDKKKQKESETYDKNFRYANVINAIRSVPRQPQRKYVDTKSGDFHRLEGSGLEPQYIYKKTFGRTPSYLVQKMQQVDTSECEQDMKEYRLKPEVRYITEPERRKLLDGLKKNWEELQRSFQLLPMLTDTVPKIRRKEQLEDELKALEHDIRTIERHPYIYVMDESDESVNSECR